MYNSFQLAGKYLRYYLSAQNSKGHGMHSPFVFQFILNVLNNRQHYQAPPAIERLRKELLSDKRMLEIEDLGAGSRVRTHKNRRVSSLASTAVKPRRLANVLFRTIQHYKPSNIIELGTSLGITSAYLATGNKNADVHTIEGSAAVAKVAKENFNKLNLQNISLIQGNFDTQLPALMVKLESIDFAYVDGNHRYQPTINYFTQLLQKTHNDSILVFDDIHWSQEMETAWEEIKNHPSVAFTIDIFFLGFVFFRHEMKVKQHFTIRV